MRVITVEISTQGHCLSDEENNERDYDAKRSNRNTNRGRRRNDQLRERTFGSAKAHPPERMGNDIDSGLLILANGAERTGNYFSRAAPIHPLIVHRFGYGI